MIELAIAFLGGAVCGIVGVVGFLILTKPECDHCDVFGSEEKE
jgi:hypothetical protein